MRQILTKYRSTSKEEKGEVSAECPRGSCRGARGRVPQTASTASRLAEGACSRSSHRHGSHFPEKLVIGFLVRHLKLNVSQMEFSCLPLLHVFPQVSSYHSSPALPLTAPSRNLSSVHFLPFLHLNLLHEDTCQFPPNYPISACFSPPHLVPLWFQLPPAPPWTSAKPPAAAGVTPRSRSFSSSLCQDTWQAGPARSDPCLPFWLYFMPVSPLLIAL